MRRIEVKEYAMLSLYDVISYPVLKRKKNLFLPVDTMNFGKLVRFSNHPNYSFRNMSFNCVDNWKFECIFAYVTRFCSKGNYFAAISAIRNTDTKRQWHCIWDFSLSLSLSISDISTDFTRLHHFIKVEKICMNSGLVLHFDKNYKLKC